MRGQKNETARVRGKNRGGATFETLPTTFTYKGKQLDNVTNRKNVTTRAIQENMGTIGSEMIAMDALIDKVNERTRSSK